MTRHAATLVVLLFSLAVPAGVSAQVCVGSGSFQDRHVHLGADLTLADAALGFHTSLGVGAKHAFGGAAIAVLDPENSEQNATGLVFFGGLEFGSGRVFVCPMADFEFMKLPDIAGVEVTGTGLAGGGRLGVVAVDGRVRVIPTVGYFHSREKLTGTLGNSEGSITRTFGLLQFGVGFVGRRMAFGPVLIVPVDLPDTSPQLRLGVGFFF